MEMCVELLFLFNSAELSLKLRYDAQIDSLDLIPLKPICSWKEKDAEICMNQWSLHGLRDIMILVIDNLIWIKRSWIRNCM